jgi:general secretion pathway protein K
MPADGSRRTSGRRAEAGSITILALWSVAIIAFLLAAATATTRTELLTTQNAIAESQARLAAVAGTQLGVARLLRRRAAGTLVFDGTPELWRDGTTPVEIAIIDEAGKLDLNEGPLELLSGLLVAVGRPREEAQLLACNIFDWRGDPDPSCPEPGGQRRSYRRFAVPEQLAQVPGFSEPLYDAVADYVTVATRASAIDPLVAARPVLLAIPGADATTVDAFLESRAQFHDVAAADSGLGPLRVLAFVTTTPAREFTIRAIAATPSRARYRADLLIRLTSTPNHPFEVLAARAPPVDRGRQMSPPTRGIP